MVPVRDPWERLDVGIPPRYFGEAAPDWTAVLRAPTSVSVTSLADVLAFLNGCRATAAPPADVPPTWPPLEAFEAHQAGNCTGHALWAWRRLVDLGFAPTLVVGRTRPFTRSAGRHAWVLFASEGTEYLLEAVAKTDEQLLRPLAMVRENYRPEVGVTAEGRTVGFAGLLLTMGHAAT